MRLVTILIFGSIVFAGCLGSNTGASDDEGQISFFDAQTILLDKLGTKAIVSAATSEPEAIASTDGKASTWVLQIFNEIGFSFYEVSSRNVLEIEPSGDFQNPVREASECTLTGDSSTIAAMMKNSLAWQEVDLLNATPGLLSDKVMGSWRAECFGERSAWIFSSSFVENTGNTSSSSRVFWLDDLGHFAAFFGDPNLNHPMSARIPSDRGINVAEHLAIRGSAVFSSDVAKFSTENSVQMAIHASVQYQGVSNPLASGTLLATGPSGREYESAWNPADAPAMYIQEVHPADAKGNWSVEYFPDFGLIDPFLVRYDICSGVLFTVDDDEVACRALKGFQTI